MAFVSMGLAFFFPFLHLSLVGVRCVLLRHIRVTEILYFRFFYFCFGMACTTGAFCLLVCFCPALCCS
jgi:hypothetical protein